jgi:hypothetical protein
MKRSMTGTDATRKKRRRGLVLQARDLDGILREIGIMRIADREQVKIAAGFHSTTRVNTRLLALYCEGLLRRVFLGAGGARKALYSLSPKGAQLIHVPCRGPRRRADEMLVADFFVQHQLTVNDVYCALKFGAMPVPGIRFMQWLAFYEPLAPGLPLIPDGYAEFATPSGIDAKFIEVDLGHESLAVWKEKVKNYLHLATSGEFAKRFKQSRFRVLILANSERRMHSLRVAVAKISQKIFRFTTLERAHRKDIFGPVWLRPVGDLYQPLFENPQ